MTFTDGCSHDTVKGGFDGVLVTFGDGCDDDTLNRMLDVSGWVINVTTSDGSAEYQGVGWGWSDDDGADREVVLRAVRWEDGTMSSEVSSIPFRTIREMHVW